MALNHIINGTFKSGELNIEGYSVSEVGKKKAASEKFRERADFDFDPQVLTDALKTGGKVFSYSNKGRVKAIYITTREDKNIFSLTKVYRSADITKEISDKMDRETAFLLSSRASYYTDGKAYFLGEQLPRLKQKSGKFSWSMAIVFMLIYAPMFSIPSGNAIGIFPGVLMGLAMGFCFKDTKYYYQKEELSE